MNSSKINLNIISTLGDSVSLVIGTNDDKFTVENLSVEIEIEWDISTQRSLLEANNQMVCVLFVWILNHVYKFNFTVIVIFYLKQNRLLEFHLWDFT